MSMKGAAFIRARQPAQKQQRYRAILDAAGELAERDGVGGVSLGDIAGRIGMHKSALLKYFGTREEIFLRLAEEEWQVWASDVVERLDALPEPDAAGRRGEQRAAATVVDSIAERPLLCQLLAYAPLILERNVSFDAMRSFKTASWRALDDVAGALHRALRTVSKADCAELLTMSGVAAAGLWQAAHPPPVVARLYAEQPLPGVADRFCAVDFTATLRRFFQVHLTGLRHSAPDPGEDSGR